MSSVLFKIWKHFCGSDKDRKSFHSEIIIKINQILSHLAARNQSEDQFDTIKNAIQKYGGHIRQATADAIAKHGNSKVKAAAKFTDTLFKGLNVFQILKQCLEIYQYIATSCNEAAQMLKNFNIQNFTYANHGENSNSENKSSVHQEMQHFAENYSEDIIEVVSNEITLIINGTIKQKSLGKVNKFIQGKVTKKFHNEGYFRAKEYKFKQDQQCNNSDSLKQKLNEDDLKGLKQNIIKNKEGKAADELDVKCLGENLGVNINIVTEDANGKKIGEDLSNNNSKDTIFLKRTIDKNNKGHFEAIIDGKVIKNDGNNNQCLYKAAAQIEASKKGKKIEGKELNERATALKAEALAGKDAATLIKMQQNREVYTGSIREMEVKYGVTGLQGKHDLTGGHSRKPVLKGNAKLKSNRHFSTNCKKSYEEAHTDHYTERLESVPKVHKLFKKAFQDGVKFEDVLKPKASHQDNGGWTDKSKKANDFKSPIDELAYVHAGHIVGLGFKEGTESKIKDLKAYNDLKILLAHTNPVSKESNQQIERNIDIQIYNVLKKNQNKEFLNLKETTREISEEIYEANRKQQSLRTTTSNKYASGRATIQNAWKHHTAFFKQANDNIEKRQ